MEDASLVLDREQFRAITLEDEDLMRQLLATLIEDTSRQLQLLELALREGDAHQCERLAHYSKGACASIGANRVAAEFERLERNASSGELQECAQQLRGLSAEVDLLRGESI